MKISRLLMSLVILGWIHGWALPLQAAPPRYRFYTPSMSMDYQVLAINDNNQTIVNYYNNYHGSTYLWTVNGGLTDLGNLGSTDTKSFAINNLGQIVGYSFVDSSPYTVRQAFLWQNGHMQNLDGLSSGYNNQAISINNLGKVLGQTFSPPNFPYFTWTQRGGIQSLDLQGGVACKIADDGSIVGQRNDHAWLWLASSRWVDLGTLPAPFDYWSIALDINKNGEVVGYSCSSTPGGVHAFSWTQSGGMKDLGTLGGNNSMAYAINSKGYIVGSADAADGLEKGCLWTPSGEKFDLDTLVINKPPNMSLGEAYDINANGVIVGRGNNGSPWYMLVPQTVTSFQSFLLLQ
jgi:probable HAF family extracellular repeat protein